METIRDSFKPITKRDPQRYIMRHVETELKTLKTAIDSGKNILAWLCTIDTKDAAEAHWYTLQQVKQYEKLFGIALERYEKLTTSIQTNSSTEFVKLKSKIKVTKQDCLIP